MFKRLFNKAFNSQNQSIEFFRGNVRKSMEIKIFEIQAKVSEWSIFSIMFGGLLYTQYLVFKVFFVMYVHTSMSGLVFKSLIYLLVAIIVFVLAIFLLSKVEEFTNYLIFKILKSNLFTKLRKKKINKKLEKIAKESMLPDDDDVTKFLKLDGIRLFEKVGILAESDVMKYAYKLYLKSNRHITKEVSPDLPVEYWTFDNAIGKFASEKIHELSSFFYAQQTAIAKMEDVHLKYIENPDVFDIRNVDDLIDDDIYNSIFKPFLEDLDNFFKDTIKTHNKIDDLEKKTLEETKNLKKLSIKEHIKSTMNF